MSDKWWYKENNVEEDFQYEYEIHNEKDIKELVLHDDGVYRVKE